MGTMKYILLALSLYATNLTIQGLRCWTCQNASSVKDCEEYGKVQRCDRNQDACGIEVRVQKAGLRRVHMKVFKFCKQMSACSELQNQNSASLWHQNQCNPKFPNSVCRCCCQKDHCNAGDLNCLTEEEPTMCIPIRFPPQFGKVECTDGGRVGSKCTFSCEKGYRLYKGDPVLTCLADNTWSSKSPVCIPIKCPTIYGISDGGYECSSHRRIGSVCKYWCRKGYRLVGSQVATCEENPADSDSGKWNAVGQRCERKRCLDLTVPDDGYMGCSDDFFQESACRILCGVKYELVGANTITCTGRNDMFTIPTWDKETPICRRKECPTFPDAPRNGSRHCTDGKDLGSSCVFDCDDYYKLVGSRETSCVIQPDQNIFGWTEKTPECILIECAALPRTPENGEMSCTHGKLLGSTCWFDCGTEYELVGGYYTRCGKYDASHYRGDHDGPFWDSETPVCRRKRCGVVIAPADGDIVCTDEDFINSKCEYVCDDFHKRIGPLYTVCSEDGDGDMRWTNDLPSKCELITCPLLSEIRFGEMNCTDGSNVNSECRFQCTEEDYKFSPDMSEMITCQNDSTWTDRAPCCSRSCPPYAVMDLIVLLDSSSSIGERSWKIMLNFINNIFELFIAKKDAMNVGVVRYNRYIDEDSQINLKECTDDVEDLKKRVAELPYNGNGTWTGQAMTHALENMLLPSNGNRPEVPDIVLVVTDGRSQDDVKQPAEALRKKGVLTFALGITPNTGSLNLEQLEEIAGDEARLMLAQNGFDTLTPEFAHEISKYICGDPCDRYYYNP